MMEVANLSKEQFTNHMDRGWQMLQERDFKGSEKAFIAAYKIHEDITAINNIAFAIWHGGNSQRAWKKLEPYLPGDKNLKPNPFSFALAAQILASLERPDEARAYITKAVKLFESGLSNLDTLGFSREAWYEYTLQIMKAAAALNDHRLVFDYYRRFAAYHMHWENHYLGGVAAFNLGRYNRAASIWGTIQQVGDFALHMQGVAFQVERGIVPPFPLEYELFDQEKLYKMLDSIEEDQAKMEEYSSKGSVRMMLLSILFSDEEMRQHTGHFLKTLVTSGGEWGTTLGLQLLEANSVDEDIKYQAAFALVEKGHFEPGQEIEVMVDGKEKTIMIETHAINLDYDPELDKLNKQAIEQKNEGRLDEAISILEPLYQQKRYYPQTMVTLANLYRQKEKYEPALQILEMVYQIVPEYPASIVNLAGVCYETGDYLRALELIDEIDREEMDEEQYQVALNIREAAEKALEMESPDHLFSFMSEIEEKMREEVEMKPLPLQAKLKRGLKNMPNDWLLNICYEYDLDPCDNRREREELIVRSLTDKDFLADHLEDFDDIELELLRYLLEHEGWARLNNVTKKFGSMDEDGYHWLEEDPGSPLGMLWSRGLVMVGRAMINNRSTRVVLIPSDLRGILDLLLDDFIL